MKNGSKNKSVAYIFSFSVGPGHPHPPENDIYLPGVQLHLHFS